MACAAARTSGLGVSHVKFAHRQFFFTHVTTSTSNRRQFKQFGRRSAQRSVVGRQPLEILAFKEYPGHLSRSPDVQEAARKLKHSHKVVLAVDDRQEGVEAVAWVLHNLVRKGDDLCLMHVVSDPRSAREATVGQSVTGKMALSSLDWGDLEPFHKEHQLRVLETASKRIRKRFAGCLKYISENRDLTAHVHLPLIHGAPAAASVGEVLVKEAHELGGRMLVLASHGTGLMAECGSVARHCCQQADLPLLLVPARMADIFPGPHRTVMVAASNIRELEQMVEWTALNMCREGDQILVCDLGSIGRVPSNLEERLYASGAANVSVLHYDNSALKQVAADVGDSHLWDADEESMTTGRIVCGQAKRMGAAAVVMVNYAPLGVVPEMLKGAVTRFVTHHCTKPVVLLPSLTLE